MTSADRPSDHRKGTAPARVKPVPTRAPRPAHGTRYNPGKQTPQLHFAGTVMAEEAQLC